MTSMAIAQFPKPEQLQALLAGTDDGPVVMLNLLRFKPAASPPDDDASGEEAYERYAAPMVEFIRERGARVLWTGRVETQVIGEGGDAFHTIALVEYPSRRAFFEIATDPYVQEIGQHRTAGLEGQWLIAASERVPGPGAG